MKFKIKFNWLYDHNGKKSAVVLSYKEYIKILDKIEDLQDIYTIYKQKTSKSFKARPLEDILAEQKK